MNRILSIPAAKFFYEAPDEGGGGDAETPVKVEPSAERIEFQKQFSANRPGLVDKDGEPIVVPPVDKKVEEPSRKIEPPKKPGSNVPSIVEAKRKAEQERDEIKVRLDKFEKEEKPGLEAKIAELEGRIADGGHTKEELTKLNEKLEAAETKLQERESSLVNENKELRSKIAYYDIQQDPEFKRTYIKPLTDAYAEAIDPIRGDEAKMQLLHKAIMANGAALTAQKPEDRAAQEKERNAILSQLTDSLDDFTRTQFTASMNAYIRATKQHAAALVAHEETTTNLRAEAEKRAAEGRVKVFDVWTKVNDQLTQVYDTDTELDDDTKDALKGLKLDPLSESKELSKTLQRIITGRGTPEESVELLQRGRVYPVMKAKLQAKDQIIKELNATIAKLRGTKPSGESKTVETEAAKPSRNDFLKRFSHTRIKT